MFAKEHHTVKLLGLEPNEFSKILVRRDEDLRFSRCFLQHPRVRCSAMNFVYPTNVEPRFRKRRPKAPGHVFIQQEPHAAVLPGYTLSSSTASAANSSA